MICLRRLKALHTEPAVFRPVQCKAIGGEQITGNLPVQSAVFRKQEVSAGKIRGEFRGGIRFCRSRLGKAGVALRTSCKNFSNNLQKRNGA